MNGNCYIPITIYVLSKCVYVLSGFSVVIVEASMKAHDWVLMLRVKMLSSSV